MDTNVLDTVTKEMPSWLAAACMLLAVGVVAFWVFQRTTSLHIFRIRIWQLFHGKAAVADPIVKAYIEERTSAQAFAFFSGVVTPTHKIPELMAWCKARKLDVRHLGYCGDYFDLETMQLTGKRPWIWLHIPLVIFFWLSFCFGAWLLLAQPQTTLLSLRETGTSFLAKKNEVKRWTQPLPWINDYIPLTDLQCEKANGEWQALADRTGFSVKETETLCGILEKTDDWHAYIKETTTYPLASSLKFLAVMLVPLFVECVALITWMSIGRVKKSIKEHAGVRGPDSPARWKLWWRQLFV